MKPFGLISDTHNHNWSSFSTTLPSGVNSRLRQILDETIRCASEVGRAGGDTIYHAGDLFHVRGSVAPSVLNPTLEVYKKLIDMGFKIVILSGNHDLEGKEATSIGSAITALQEVGCKVINSIDDGATASDDVVMVPWIPQVADLKDALTRVSSVTDSKDVDLIIHAGIDGVIKGLPNHGLSKEFLAGLGFRRVFAGHYHHHRDLGDGVYSIGALTHQTWSDVGSKAGFLVVSDSEVKWHASHAPSFVEIDAATAPEDIPLIVDGNYVRAKTYSGKSADLEALRKFLTDSGARGVTIVAQPATGVTRTASTVKAGASIEVSVSDYINGADFDNTAKLNALCHSILTEVRGEE